MRKRVGNGNERFTLSLASDFYSHPPIWFRLIFPLAPCSFFSPPFFFFSPPPLPAASAILLGQLQTRVETITIVKVSRSNRLLARSLFAHGQALFRSRRLGFQLVGQPGPRPRGYPSLRAHTAPLSLSLSFSLWSCF